MVRWVIRSECGLACSRSGGGCTGDFGSDSSSEVGSSGFWWVVSIAWVEEFCSLLDSASGSIIMLSAGDTLVVSTSDSYGGFDCGDIVEVFISISMAESVKQDSADAGVGGGRGDNAGVALAITMELQLVLPVFAFAQFRLLNSGRCKIQTCRAA